MKNVLCVNLFQKLSIRSLMKNDLTNFKTLCIADFYFKNNHPKNHTL